MKKLVPLVLMLSHLYCSADNKWPVMLYDCDCCHGKNMKIPSEKKEGVTPDEKEKYLEYAVKNGYKAYDFLSWRVFKPDSLVQEYPPEKEEFFNYCYDRSGKDWLNELKNNVLVGEFGRWLNHASGY